MLVGVLAFGATTAGIALLSNTVVRPDPASTSTILSQAALGLVIWTAGALLEEATLRGYILVQLAHARSRRRRGWSG